MKRVAIDQQGAAMIFMKQSGDRLVAMFRQRICVESRMNTIFCGYWQDLTQYRVIGIAVFDSVPETFRDA